MPRMLYDEDRDEDRDEPIDVFFDDVLVETDRAYLFRLQSGEEQWLPKSQISHEKPDVLEKGCGAGHLCIPMWLADKEGLA